MLASLILLACNDEKSVQQTKDNFNNSNSLRIVEPSNGDTVDTIFDVVFEAGSSISYIGISSKSGDSIAEVDLSIVEDSFLLQLDSGNQNIVFDAPNAQHTAQQL